MTEQATELHELFTELDENIRELLSLVKTLKIDFTIHADDEAISRLEKSLFLAQKIESHLYSLKREVDEQ
ncbi:protein D-63 [Saccharolobus shibatae]|uniref:Four-helix bundle protein n=2 Tax=Saccharolobus shibatae TaxID=2286 RepID=A0A8F5BKR9_SACSH|nr:protein D-63 [Saccharolobus shibatae]QXJ27102.1 Four-helix bundle protein [Saccharolobus shibatae B12]QXJ29995.1 Four-helix bundle protein [Saccharolobus shibatae B12]QXJ30319.1 Four-helix bundle protein [Saccharolobus shibatae]QXJ30421.1 Four-helix bundle protein [Saccharolobus shibatae]